MAGLIERWMRCTVAWMCRCTGAPETLFSPSLGCSSREDFSGPSLMPSIGFSSFTVIATNIAGRGDMPFPISLGRWLSTRWQPSGSRRPWWRRGPMPWPHFYQILVPVRITCMSPRKRTLSISFLLAGPSWVRFCIVNGSSQLLVPWLWTLGAPLISYSGGEQSSLVYDQIVNTLGFPDFKSLLQLNSVFGARRPAIENRSVVWLCSSKNLQKR